MTVLWTITDLVTTEVWEFTYNPNGMTGPHNDRATVTSHLSPIDGSIRGIRKLAEPKDWSFSGFIRSEDHFDQLRDFAKRGNLCHLTDHLGRTFLIRLIQFIPKERTPTKTVSWRFFYEMKALVYKKVS